MLSRQVDAFGNAFRAYLAGDATFDVVERDDGYVEVEELSPYFADRRDWPAHQRRAIRFARGRTLDIGCGAGRHALHLQDRGLEVIATDVSPGAIHVCRQRGVKQARLVAVTRIPARWGPFDTVLMLGNNFGLVADRKRAPWLLKRLATLTSPGARIVAQSNDVYATDRPEHLAYHERNRARGRMAGQIRLRIL